MTHTLKILQRLLVQNFLVDKRCVAQEGGHIFLTAKRTLKEKIEVKPEEHKDANLEILKDENGEPTGKIKFDVDYSKAIELTEFEDDIVKDNLKRLERENKLPEEYLELYDIFVLKKD